MASSLLSAVLCPPGSIAPTGGWVNAKSDFRRCANCRGGVSGAAARIAVRWTSSRSRAKPPSPQLDARPAERQWMALASTRSEIGPGRFDLPQIQEFLPARQAGLVVLKISCDIGRGCRLGSAAKASYFEVRCLSLAGGEPLGHPNRSCGRVGRSRPTARRRPSQRSPTSNLSAWSNLSRATESPSRTPGSSSSISIVCASRAVAPL